LNTEPYLLPLLTGIIAIVCQILLFTRIKKNTQKRNNGRFVFTITIWAILQAFILYKDEGLLIFSYLVSSLQISLFHLLLYKTLDKRINLSRAQSLTSLISCSLTVIASIALILTDENTQLIITSYGFFGITASLMLLLYCERLFQLSRAGKQFNHGVTFSLAGISIAYFLSFCDLIISPHTSSNQTLWLSSVMLLTLPFLYKGSSALQSIPVKLKASRPLVFHVTLFTVAGTYLFGASSIITIMQMYGVRIDYTSKIILLTAIAFPCIYLLSSKSNRSYISVWISKHLFSTQFDYHETWKRLNVGFEQDLEGSSAAATGFKTIMALIKHHSGCYYQIHNNSLSLVASEGSGTYTHLNEQLLDIANQLKDTPWIIDVCEATKAPALYPMISTDFTKLDDHSIKWIIPVYASGDIVGIWLLSNTAPLWSLNWETRDYVNAISAQFAIYLQTQEYKKKIREQAQLAAFYKTSAFIIHDMKNVYAQLNMLLENASVHKRNPEFIDDMLVTMGSMKTRTEKMLAQLTNKQNNTENSESHFSVVMAIKDIFSGISLKKYDILPTLKIELSGDFVVFANKERFFNIIHHLLDNAQCACNGKGDDGEVHVRCRVDNNNIIISIMDNGIGISDDYMENRLFKPFETTKGNSGIGLGVYDAKQFAEQYSGTLVIESELNIGTSVHLTLPARE
jgi:putative PEP-CTERM system histidine kinase